MKSNVIQLHSQSVPVQTAVEGAKASIVAIYEQLRAQAGRRRPKPVLRLIKGGKADGEGAGH